MRVSLPQAIFHCSMQIDQRLVVSPKGPRTELGYLQNTRTLGSTCASRVHPRRLIEKSAPVDQRNPIAQCSVGAACGAPTELSSLGQNSTRIDQSRGETRASSPCDLRHYP